MSRKKRRFQNQHNKNFIVDQEAYKEFCEFQQMKSSLINSVENLREIFIEHKNFLAELQIDLDTENISRSIWKILHTLDPKENHKKESKKSKKQKYYQDQILNKKIQEKRKLKTYITKILFKSKDVTFVY